MRIGMISTYPPIECGIATYTQYLTSALREKHTEVYIVSHIGGYGQQVFPSFDYEDRDLSYRAYSTMVRFTPDVIHIQHEFGLYGEFLGVAVVPLIIKFRLSGIPVVTTLHTVYETPPEKHRIVLESILLNSQRVIVHEDYQKEALIQCMPFPVGTKIRVIAHGARELDPIANAKEKLGLPRDKKVILLIGYFRPNKNFELIVNILPDILKQFKNAILVIAGKVRGNEHLDYRTKLFNLIKDSPAREHIFLIRGQLEQHVFDTILSAADVVVLPYKISSQSGIMAHALAFGKPVVTSESGAMRRIIERSKAGLVCGSTGQFIENIVKILKDEQLAKRFSENARSYVRNSIGWSLIAEKHQAIYRELMEKPILESRTIWLD